MRMLQRLWADEAGFVISAELVLVATIVVIGMIVGLTTIRNQVVQELIDVGQAIGFVSQSYAYGGIAGNYMHNCGWTDGSGYLDRLDFCQQIGQMSGQPAGGIQIAGVPNPAFPNNPTGGEQ